MIRRRLVLMMPLPVLVGFHVASGVGAAQLPSDSPLPPHDYSIVVPSRASPAVALTRVREGMMTALAASGVLQPAYPQRGTTVETPSPGDARTVIGSCAEIRAGSPDSTCIRLGPVSYVRFGIVRHPESRMRLFEVWPFERVPGRTLARTELDSLPRVVVDQPFVGDDLQQERGLAPRLIDALQRGLALAGARPLAVR